MITPCFYASKMHIGRIEWLDGSSLIFEVLVKGDRFGHLSEVIPADRHFFIGDTGKKYIIAITDEYLKTCYIYECPEEWEFRKAKSHLIKNVLRKRPDGIELNYEAITL